LQDLNGRRMKRRKKILAVVIIVILVLAVALIGELYDTGATKYNPTFSFNQTQALPFYSKLAIPTEGGALLQPFPGSERIYLADDQALDYYALLNIANSTHSTLASSLASEINGSISAWGGFYKYWNPVFVVTGDYPNVWIVENGSDRQIGSLDSGSENYSVKATVFLPNPSYDYYNYSDQDFYYSLWYLHSGNYSGAENAFAKANSFWNGYGFKDSAFSSGEYDSYKLALDLIVWKLLEANHQTSNFANGYILEMKNVTSIMSQLQGSDGGVWTNYMVSNGQIVFGNIVSLENGETTSLFVIAAS
jgi:hypothetical protein